MKNLTDLSKGLIFGMCLGLLFPVGLVIGIGLAKAKEKINISDTTRICDCKTETEQPSQ